MSIFLILLFFNFLSNWRHDFASLSAESDYSDEEFHAEYSYLSLIREVAESSEASNPQQLLPGPNPSAIQPEKLTSGAPNQMIMSSNDDSSGDPLLVSLAESENAIG